MGKKWSDKEDFIITELYSLNSQNKIEILLPQRTQNSIRARACFLNIKKSNRKKWTSAEDEILRQFYGKISMKDLLNFLPNRSPQKIYSHATKYLKLRKEIPSDVSLLTPSFLRIFDGLMLGDGGLMKPKIHAYFTYSGMHKAVAQFIKDLFVSVGFIFPESNPYRHIKKRDGKELWISRCNVHTFFTEQYYRWYPQGKKIIPRDIVLYPETIKHWYYGDGGIGYCYHVVEKVIFSTNCFTYSDLQFLGDALLSAACIGHYRLKCVRPEQYVLEIRKSDIPQLLNCIGPCDIPCYQYKWIIDDRELYDYHKNNCPCKKEGILAV